jgi:DNA-binding PadR family transcriptional regulator
MVARAHPSWLVIHILTQLKAQPMAAKELREELKGRFPTLSPGTFYPAMQKMVEEGWVNKTPLPIKMPGRRQSVYTITRAGEEQIEAVMSLLLSSFQDKIWDMLGTDEQSALPAAQGLTTLVGWRGGEAKVLELAKRIGKSGRVYTLKLPGTDRGVLKKTDWDVAGMPEVSELELTGTSIPLQDSCIDEVVLGGVVSMLDDKGSLIREVRRVLKPEGVLVIQELEPTDHVIYTLWVGISGLGERYHPVDMAGLEMLMGMLDFEILKRTSHCGVNRIVALKPDTRI